MGDPKTLGLGVPFDSQGMRVEFLVAVRSVATRGTKRPRNVQKGWIDLFSDDRRLIFKLSGESLAQLPRAVDCRINPRRRRPELRVPKTRRLSFRSFFSAIGLSGLAGFVDQRFDSIGRDQSLDVEQGLHTAL